MATRAGLQTPYDNAVAPTPDGGASDGGIKGGYDFPEGRKESPNSVSGLPALPTTVGVPGEPGSQVAMPPVASPGTIKTEGV